MSPSEAAAYCQNISESESAARFEYLDKSTTENKAKLDELSREKNDIEQFLNILLYDDYDGNYSEFYKAIKSTGNSAAARTADRLYEDFVYDEKNGVCHIYASDGNNT